MRNPEKIERKLLLHESKARSQARHRSLSRALRMAKVDAPHATSGISKVIR